MLLDSVSIKAIMKKRSGSCKLKGVTGHGIASRALGNVSEVAHSQIHKENFDS